MTAEQDREDDSADAVDLNHMDLNNFDEDDDEPLFEDDDEVDCGVCGEPLNLTSGLCDNPDCPTNSDA